MSDEQKLAVLAYAHNQGAGGARDWLNTGIAKKDGFGTYADRYSNLFLSNLKKAAATFLIGLSLNPRRMHRNRTMTKIRFQVLRWRLL